MKVINVSVEKNKGIIVGCDYWFSNLNNDVASKEIYFKSKAKQLLVKKLL